ncbi:thioredoxin family protein [Mycobacterium sp. Aquia_216]|uniref:thioredoxin family protein n=1 Tax=Mycobacterium sp. Aquia_216 TaxID=2991729 RepID=UPI00227D1109|nr:thioredoxin family protein [Mycobacterium sp. Aquia_216]WAJ44626.1 thioredoxin family protein [Mycobacterium sp. Aquia_216]
MTTVVVAIVAALALAAVVGWLVTRRSGSLKEVASDPSESAGADTADLGLSATGPTVVHFSAPWCGPCDRLRRVVDQVCDSMGDVAHVEVDIDANPAAARQFSVMSLPTTLIFDVDGRQRYRASGVPKAADLRSALEPLLA